MICRCRNGRGKTGALGADALSSQELIAILLRTGTWGTSALHVAEQLLARFKTLENLARAPLEELRKTKGVGRDKAIALKAAFTMALRMARELATKRRCSTRRNASRTCCVRRRGWSTSSASSSCC